MKILTAVLVCTMVLGASAMAGDEAPAILASLEKSAAVEIDEAGMAEIYGTARIGGFLGRLFTLWDTYTSVEAHPITPDDLTNWIDSTSFLTKLQVLRAHLQMFQGGTTD